MEYSVSNGDGRTSTSNIECTLAKQPCSTEASILYRYVSTQCFNANTCSFIYHQTIKIDMVPRSRDAHCIGTRTGTIGMQHLDIVDIPIVLRGHEDGIRSYRTLNHRTCAGRTTTIVSEVECAGSPIPFIIIEGCRTRTHRNEVSIFPEKINLWRR